uniref:Uncharacterized protein n=1 Tax=Rhizophora mucronata TaxID=61149 RepID=A0A2P2JYS3_RHIMU
MESRQHDGDWFDDGEVESQLSGRRGLSEECKAMI